MRRRSGGSAGNSLRFSSDLTDWNGQKRHTRIVFDDDDAPLAADGVQVAFASLGDGHARWVGARPAR